MGGENPNYVEGGQPRDKIKTSVVNKIAERPDADSFSDIGRRGSDGPPVVVEWPASSGKLHVLSGNHRWWGAVEAMKRGTFGKVTEAYKAMARSVGLDPESIGPGDVLYRKIKTPASIEELRKLARAYNEKSVQDYSAGADAAVRAADLTDGAVELISRGMDRIVEANGGKATVNQMLDSTEGPAIVRKLIEDKVIKYTDENRMIKGDKLTTEGKRAVKATIGKKLLDGVETTDKVETNVVSALDVLVRGDAAAPDVKILDKVREAARLVKEVGNKRIDDYLSQGQLGGQTPKFEPEVANLAKALRNLTATDFKSYIQGEITRLAKPTELFGSPEPRELLAHPKAPTMREGKPGFRASEKAETAERGDLPDWASPLMRDRIAPGQGKLPGTTPPAPPIPPRTPKPPRGDGWKDWSTGYSAEEKFNPDATLKTGEEHLSKVLPATDGFYERSNMVRKGAEPEVKAQKEWQKDHQRLGTDAERQQLREAMNAPGAALTLSRLVSGDRLNAIQAATYSKHKALFDKAASAMKDGLEWIRIHDRPFRLAAEQLREAGDVAGAEAMEAQRLAIGDLGEGYFPWRLTNGRLMEFAKRNGLKAVLDLVQKKKYANLDFSREGQVEPESNGMDTAESYWEDVRLKQAQRPLVVETEAFIEKLRKAGRPEDSFAIKKYLDNNILGEKSELDQSAFRKHIQRMLNEPEYAKKWADEPINRAPVSGMIGWWNGNISLWTVFGNLSSAATASIANTARTASEFGVKEFFNGATKATEYAKAKMLESAGIEMSPEMKEFERKHERISGLEESGQENVTGIDEGLAAKGGKVLRTLRKAGYAGVRWPDILSKITAGEAVEAELRAANPTWSEQKIETHTAVRVAQITDVAKEWSKSPTANHPVSKLLNLFAQSGIRETTQMYRQLTSGPDGWAKLAKNTGIRIAFWAALFKLTRGTSDPEEAMKRVARAVPHIGQAIEGRAPAALFPFQLGAKGAQAAKVAATGRGFGDDKPMSPKQKSKVYRDVLPAAGAQSGFRRLFLKQKN